MIFDHDELASAIFLFDRQGGLLREMLYSEFEAILDGYVPVRELANQTIPAVFAQINSKLLVERAVFFWVSLTRTGEIDPSWNLPLDQLAMNASAGPDLGAGPIKLACASQCPISHHRGSLWDPDLRKGKGQLTVLKKSAALNRLSIQFREPSKDELEQAQSREKQEQQRNFNEEYLQELRSHMAHLLKEQRLKASTIEREHEREIKELKTESANRLEEYRQLLDSKGRALEEERERNKSLKETIEGQAKKIEGLREYFEHKLSLREGEESDHIEALKQNYETELELKVNAATTELQELLQMREVELLYRNEQEAQLHDEIARLRQENEQFVANSGDRLLDKMASKGISFVTYQPGAGHITLPKSEISRFMDNPIAYAAGVCGVQEGHYLAWLEHYQAPVCRHCDEAGTICSANIQRINSPSEFHIGHDDHCDQHKKIKSINSLKLAGA